MNAAPIDWKRLFELVDTFYELQPRQRQSWLDGLGDVGAATKVQLLKFIADRSSMERANFLNVPPQMPGAANLEPPPQLSEALGQFIAGTTDLDALRTIFRDYLERNAQESESVARWLRQSAASGRLSKTVHACLSDLLLDLDKGPKSAQCRATPGSIGAEARNSTVGHSNVAPEAAMADATAQRSDAHTAAASAADVPMPRVGMVLKDRFTLIEELGHGGMGSVFKARDRLAEEAEDKNPFVAIKILSQDFKRHPDADKALRWEAKRAHTLAHPNVITVYQFDRDGPYAFMTMEYLEGHPLDILLATDFAHGIPLEKAWPIIHSICAALDYGHNRIYGNKKGIVHSDLKPGNVFVCNDGCVKVLDFGISRPMPAPGKDSQTTQFDPGKRLRALTPAYASLEMWSGAPPAPSDDIYALGCITYELLTGRHPFLSTNAATGETGPCAATDALAAEMSPRRIDSLSRQQWEALRKALALRRADRTASVSDFERCFEPKSFVRRHAVWIGLALLVAVAAALIAGANYIRSNAQDDWALPDRLQRHVEITANQKKQVTVYLTAAADSLKEATLKLSPQDLTYILSDGANNVHEILGAALAIEPDNKSALKMKSDIAALYAQKARDVLDAGGTAQALALVKKGLVEKRNDRALNGLYHDICRRPEVEGCE